MKKLTRLLRLSAIAGVFAASQTIAQDSPIFTNPDLNRDYGYNYQELNNIDPSVETLTTDLFGDNIDPGSGSLRFSQTDVSLPGNFSLPVSITRSLSDPSGWHRENRMLGNWSLDIPHVRSLFVTRQGRYDNAYWAVGQACSRPLNSNPNFSADGHVLNKGDYWNGDTAYIPGQGSAMFLARSATNKRYNNQNWDVSCWNVPGQSHEGFKIVTGDGTQYFFGQQLIRTDIDRRSMSPIPQPCTGDCTISLDPSSGSTEFTVRQHHVFMLISKVVDKFGSEVNYTYAQGTAAQTEANLLNGTDSRLSTKLTRIRASDGRQIDLTYSGDVVRTVKANNRTWTYSYAQGALTNVAMPNGQSWQFNNGGSNTYYGFWRERFPPSLLFGDGCINTLGLESEHFITMTHPYGMKGTFNVGAQCFGQVDIPQLRQFDPRGVVSHWIQRENRNIVLDNKVLTFSDGTKYTWNYDYSFNKGLFKNQSATTCTSAAQPLSQCHTVRYNNQHRSDLKTTKITQPDGDYSIHYFDRTYGVDRDNLVAMESYEPSGKLLSRSTYTYDLSPSYGDNRTYISGFVVASSPARPDGLKNSYRDQVLVRTKKRTTQLFNGASSSLGAYTQEVLSFDTYNQPTKVKGSSTQGTRYIRFGYLPKTANGVFNLPTTTDISTTDGNYTQVSRTSYKNLTARQVKVPNQTFGYGQLKQTNVSYHTTTGEIGQPLRVEYNAAKSVGTGNRYLEYRDYHRGIPREIRMPQRLSSTGIQSATRTVDNNGWVTSFTDLNGNTTHYGYDAMGRFRYIDQPGTNQWLDTTFTWTAQTSSQGPKRVERRCTLNAAKTACAGGTAFAETLSFDNLLRPTLTTRSGGGITRYQNKRFDSYNQETFASFWSNTATETGGTTNTFDALQRLRNQATTGLGVNTTNYLSNNRMQSIDAEGNRTTTTYRAYGQPNYEQATRIQSPEGVNTALSVDVFGLINSITQSGGGKSNTEYRAYNSFKQLCQVKRSDVGTTGYQLNALGQPIAMASGITNSSNTACLSTLPSNLRITNTYDNLGDTRSINYPDTSPDLTYSYDRQGNLTRLQAGNTVHTYTYNNLHLLESERLSLDNKNLDLDYSYNTLGHVSSLKYPNTDTVSFAPNAFGEPTTATATRPGLANFTYASGAIYYPTGSIDYFTYGNGIAHKTVLNSAKLPSRLRDASASTTALDYSYTYDNNQNVKSLTDNQNAHFSLTNLTYDGLDRLKTITAGTGIGNTTLSYDALGNITQYNNKQQHLSYNYNSSNQLTGVNKTDAPTVTNYRAFTYDNRGNVTNNGYRAFNFNLANQLQSSTKGSTTNTYVYDGHNRRVKQVDSKGTSYSMYSQDGTLLYRETQDGPINYIYLGKRLIAKDGFIPENAGDQHYHAFGSSVEGEIDDAGYTGHKFDTDLQLSYMQARYYDPMIGRFYSNDPVDALSFVSEGNIQGFSRYTYVNNNPYRYVDPDGRKLEATGTESEIKQIEAAITHIEENGGAELVQALRDSDYLITVEITNGANETTFFAEAGANPDIGSGSLISFNPNKFLSGETDNGNQIRPSFVGLAHEFGHAEAAASGTHPISDEDPNAAIPTTEVHAVRRENQVRGALGIGTRIKY